jgi:hypothetical protein
MSPLRGQGGIFISYRREETAPYAGRLYDHLGEHFGEDNVFMDIDTIPLGSDFAEAVREAVSRCNILLALIGRNWSAVTDVKGIRRIDYPYDFVRVEIETALQRNIRVVPVLVDGASLPQADDLPSSLRPLVRRQALELSHTGFRSEVSRLIAAIDEVLETRPGWSAEPSATASRDAVVQQGIWQLKLLSDEPFKKTFRLVSGSELHDITLKFGAIRGAIEVDGQLIVRRLGFNPMKPYPLRTLSSALGYDVTMQYEFGLNLSGATIKQFIVNIGNQVLAYQP